MYLSRLTLDPRFARDWLGDCHTLHRAVMSGFGQVEDEPARAALGVLFRVDFPSRPGAPVHLLVQSREAPRWTFETRAVVGAPETRPLAGLLARFATGARFRFRLRANPTRRIHHRATLGPDLRELDTAGRWRAADAIPAEERTGVVRRRGSEGAGWWREREDGKRIGKRVELHTEEERLAWLREKGAGENGRPGCGFALVTVRLAPSLPLDGRNARVDALAARADPAGALRSADRRLTFATALFEGELLVRDAEAFRESFANGVGPGKAFGCGLLSLAPV